MLFKGTSILDWTDVPGRPLLFLCLVKCSRTGVMVVGSTLSQRRVVCSLISFMCFLIPAVTVVGTVNLQELLFPVVLLFGL